MLSHFLNVSGPTSADVMCDVFCKAHNRILVIALLYYGVNKQNLFYQPTASDVFN